MRPGRLKSPNKQKSDTCTNMDAIEEPFEEIDLDRDCLDDEMSDVDFEIPPTVTSPQEEYLISTDIEDDEDDESETSSLASETDDLLNEENPRLKRKKC